MSIAKRRKTNTSTEQYEMYLQVMESDYAFRSGTINPTLEENYINNKWYALVKKLNASGDGPNLSVEEWKKRFGDWKYATKAKYRKISEHRRQTGSGPPLKIKLTELEERGLAVWGKVSVTGSLAIPSYDGIEVEYVNEIANENYDAVSVFNIIEESSCVLPSETDGVIITNEGQTNTPTDKNMHSTIETTPKPEKKRKCKPKPLNELAQQLLEQNKKAEETQQTLVTVLSGFCDNYINLKREKLKFEIAKYKYEHKDFMYE